MPAERDHAPRSLRSPHLPASASASASASAFGIVPGPGNHQQKIKAWMSI
ncbi:hypothetical protein RR42_m1847 [Cupriavidus basilensis]|uniref:Uncharacterized protein n=1 Tax=Cupriavidus basilensis TaxID=68895 RepID=A0A0C4Y2A1_9BURK|nr:hypothetical protein RR42_m1847 [Cupriavidus basilensis]